MTPLHSHLAAAHLERRARLGMGPAPVRRLAVVPPPEPEPAPEPEAAQPVRLLGDRMRVRDVVAASAAHVGVAVDDVLSPRRLGPLLRARQLAMYLANELTGASYCHIGRELHRDHTTVMSGARKVAALVAAGDEQAIADIAAVRERLEGGQ